MNSDPSWQTIQALGAGAQTIQASGGSHQISMSPGTRVHSAPETTLLT